MPVLNLTIQLVIVYLYTKNEHFILNGSGDIYDEKVLRNYGRTDRRTDKCKPVYSPLFRSGGIKIALLAYLPGRVAQSIGHLTRKSEVLGSIPDLVTYFRSPSADSRGAVASYWRKYVHEVLVYRLGGISLPRKSAVRLIDRPDMTLDVYLGRKTTTQQQQQQY